MSHVSYLIETNGENGVHIDYIPLSFAPSTIEWVEGVNSFLDGYPLPDVESQESPTYVRQRHGNEWDYYRRTIVMPPKTATFLLSVLIDGAENNGGFTYDTFTSFFSTSLNGGFIEVTSKANTSKIDREGTIFVKSNQYNEGLQIFILQEHTPIDIWFNAYVSHGLCGEVGGDIGLSQRHTFTHTFHWLTQKETVDKEILQIEVRATGPRNGFVVKSVDKYVYYGELDDTCVYSTETEKYYRIVQKYTSKGLENVFENIIFDSVTQSIYTKAKYDNNLKYTVNENLITLTNYGRCFLENDAYYVMTLSNVDDLDLEIYLIIKYENDNLNSCSLIMLNPYMWMENGRVMLHTDNEVNANEHFIYYVSFETGQLVYSTDKPSIITSRIENNELITSIENGL